MSPLYDEFVALPKANSPTPRYLANNPRYLEFENARCVLDCFHTPAAPSQATRKFYADRQGKYTWTHLIAVDWDMRIRYMSCGHTGSKADAHVFEFAKKNGLTLHPGQYFIADAGFPLLPNVIVPYRNQRYHLREEWEAAADEVVSSGADDVADVVVAAGGNGDRGNNGADDNGQGGGGGRRNLA